MSVTFSDSRQGPGTLKLATTEFGHQAAAVRLTPDVSSEDGTPTLAVPDPAPESSIALGAEHRRDPGLRQPGRPRQLPDGQRARRGRVRVDAAHGRRRPSTPAPSRSSRWRSAATSPSRS